MQEKENSNKITLKKESIQTFQEEILTWFSLHQNQRDLPWRHSRDPYAILVSEIMSQQTQISRVVEKYNQWMEVFPNMENLSNASVGQVLSLWSGLGYNRRALWLQACTQIIQKKFHGIFPRKKETLLSLPGIGQYTASAICCFAFNEQIPLIDTNIRKVIAIKFCQGKVPSNKVIQVYAHLLLPKGKAYEWNQALMDYARIELKNEKISIKKQTKFKGSRRYYRGCILKYLVEHKREHMHSLSLLFHTSLSPDELYHILNGLEKDGLIEQKDEMITLP